MSYDNNSIEEGKGKIKHLEEKFSFARFELIKECEADELRFYLYLKLYAINKHSAFPSKETIEQDIGWKPQTVQYWVKKMVGKGRLKYTPGGGRRSSLYDITWYDTLNLRGVSKHTPMKKHSADVCPDTPELKVIERKENIYTSIFQTNKQVIINMFKKTKVPQAEDGVYDWRWVIKRADINPHLFFIGLFWKKRDYKFENSHEAQGEIKRITKKAVDYCGKYTLKKFKDMLDWIEEDAEKKGGYTWTFETLDKKLSEFNLANEPITL